MDIFADQLTALTDKTRLGILLTLAHGEANVSALCDDFDLPQPTVSHHLGLLREAGLVLTRRAGKKMFYQLNPTNCRADGAGICFTFGAMQVSLHPLTAAAPLREAA